MTSLRLLAVLNLPCPFPSVTRDRRGRTGHTPSCLPYLVPPPTQRRGAICRALRTRVAQALQLAEPILMSMSALVPSMNRVAGMI